MYTFIVNPNAKTSLGYQVWSSLEAILKEKNVNYQVFFTKYQKHATRLAQKLTQESGAKTLIVLGGDGTINEVINGIKIWMVRFLAIFPSDQATTSQEVWDCPLIRFRH